MRKNIAITYGGFSGEAQISAKSVLLVMEHIDKKKFNAIPIKIVDNNWIAEIDKIEIPVNKNDFSIEYNGKIIHFNAVFNVIHGTPGEDGKLQGYFDLLNIPYNNSGVLTSAVTFNKNVCNNLIKRLGINAAESILIKRGQKFDIAKLATQLGLPCFVKPNKGGSSIGTSKVMKKSEIKPAIECALKEDDEVLIESFVKGRELTSGVFRFNNELIAFPITEIVSTKEFFDFEAKYTDGLTNEITPAPVPKKISELCQKTSKYIYDSLDCKGFARVDYIWTGTDIFFLEINTVPGMSKNSIIPQQGRAMGIKDKELISMAIEETLRTNK